MGRSFMLICAAAVVSVVFAATAFATSAQDAPMTAEILNGSCEPGGEVVYPLEAPTLPTGSQLGGNGGVPAANSFSTVAAPISQLTSTDHAIVVEDGDVRVCGLIAGPTTDAGSLVMGIAAENASELSGVAFL